MKYNHREIEQKWQKVWEQTEPNRVSEDVGAKKYYVLDMFPYPSGYGLHVGHPVGYIGSDIIARKRRMEGYAVLHPMGWDAFGLPAENFAIKKGVHPHETTQKNIANIRRQLKMLGFSYDWSREVDTSSPEYYRWTQWLFLLFYKNGLAYKKKAPVNWCPSCQTVLANEQVVDGRCERCHSDVMQKELSQWFFKVTQYADRLLDGLDGLDWPERIKVMQTNWIGRSEGVEVFFGFENGGALPVFTTRVDTLFSGTFVILAPEHPLVASITTPAQRDDVDAYVAKTLKRSELERTGTELEKTGVFTGAYVINPATDEKIPVWIADFVLANYGTGAVFADAHDERDFAMAKKYGIPLKVSIRPADDALLAEVQKLETCFSGDGVLVNSGEFEGLTSSEARTKIGDWLVAKGAGVKKVNYHLRDWLISRQRYWGAPIPIIYCDVCGEQPVPEKDLPVLLPTDVDFRPTGESPLARSLSFQDVRCPKCGGAAQRESDTMDTFVDSSWYFLRYASPHNQEVAFEKTAVAEWCPIDLYVGGAEHAVLHLLYARFFTKVLHDLSYLTFDEPFLRLKNQGLILGPDGQKMSKSVGNVINPDDVVVEYGADTLRMYEMFMADFGDLKPWDTKGIVGVRRFLDRVWTLVGDLSLLAREASQRDVVIVQRTMESHVGHEQLIRSLHKTIKKVSSDIEAFKFNTAISAMMIFVNEWSAVGGANQKTVATFLQLLAPFAPHISEELWQKVGEKGSVFATAWPTFDAALTIDATVEIAVQINGKVRDHVTVSADATDDEVKATVLASETTKKFLEGKSIKHIVVVKGRLVSIVVV